jgi:hypothetical protein
MGFWGVSDYETCKSCIRSNVFEVAEVINFFYPRFVTLGIQFPVIR